MVSSSEEEEGSFESAATSVDEDFSGTATNTAYTGSTEKAQTPGKKPDKRKKDKCTFPSCRRMGHTEEKCWKKFPHLKKNQGSSNSGPAFSATSEKPGQRRQGHRAQQKPGKVKKAPVRSGADAEE